MNFDSNGCFIFGTIIAELRENVETIIPILADRAKKESEANQKVLTDVNCWNEVLQSRQPVVAEFTANWSGACYIMSPVKMRITAEYNGQKEVNMMIPVKNQLQKRLLTITHF